MTRPRLTAALDAPFGIDRRRFDQEEGCLIGGECPQCGARAWPRRSVCYGCGGGEIVEVQLPSQGLLVTWTRVWVAVEGIKPPYTVGLVELGRLQLFGHVVGVTDDTKVPVDVQLKVDVDRQPPFWFEVLDS